MNRGSQTPQDVRPLHLVAEPGDKRAICGIKNSLPVCWVKFGPVHLRHRPGCADCLQGAGLTVTDGSACDFEGVE